MSDGNKYHKVSVNLEAIERGHTLGSVLIDGTPVKAVRSIVIRASYNAVTEVTFTIIADVSAEIDGAEIAHD